MLKTILVRAVACVPIGLAALLFVPLCARAQAFDVRPGEWETTTTMSGSVISSDLLAKLTAERRAAVEKMMAERGLGNGKPTVHRSCVTKEDLAKDNFGREPASNCKQTTVSRSSTKLVMETTCSGPPPLKGSVVIEAKTPQSVVGTIDQQRPDGSKFHIDMLGKWIAATCDADSSSASPSPGKSR